MGINKDILEGMRSAFDLSGSRNFNGYRNYPTLNGAIRNTWYNVGCHINSAMGKVVSKNGIRDKSNHRYAVYPKAR